jgi:UDP-hydrolysing UDP-N-acetyl-D-glucosamine 2-epimerase
VRQLGEEPWRITVCGALSLDNLASEKRLDRVELEERLGFRLETPSLLVTFHPVTLQPEQMEWQSSELLSALAEAKAQIILTLPNADAGGRRLAALMRGFVERTPAAHLVENLGTALYFSLMQHTSAMVGNSSSGLIEAPSFELPVVNIGQRQAGRVRGLNVLDVAEDRVSILAGIETAISPRFRSRLRGQPNPYDQGQAAAHTIAERLCHAPLDERLLCKKFHDLEIASL